MKTRSADLALRNALSWIITQRVVLFITDVSGPPICPIFKG